MDTPFVSKTRECATSSLKKDQIFCTVCFKSADFFCLSDSLWEITLFVSKEAKASAGFRERVEQAFSSLSPTQAGDGAKAKVAEAFDCQFGLNSAAVTEPSWLVKLLGNALNY